MVVNEALVRDEIRRRMAIRVGLPRPEPVEVATIARPQYRPQGNLREIFEARDKEVLVEGPAGSGKTRAILERWHQIALRYPGAKGLIFRKTLKSLTGSGLETYRRDVLPGSGVRAFGGNWQEPPQYIYPNGSRLFLGSVNTEDAIDKLKSTDYDWIYPQEATEIEESHLEVATTRLRTGVVDFQQIIADCNPDAPSHWLNQRAEAGKMRRIRTTHQDNPRYYDAVAQTWTPEGESYVLGTLAALTGVLRDRLFLGKWRAAEGVVYEGWDARIHVIEAEAIAELAAPAADGFYELNRERVRHVWGCLDWGFTNPGVLGIYLEDGDGRLIRIHELMRVGQLIGWWVEEAKRYYKRYRVEQFIADPSEPAYIAQFRAAGLPTLAGWNEVKPGIQFVAKRLQVAGDGRPRFQVVRADPDDADPRLRAAKKPWCLEQEVEGYIWEPGRARGEEPVKVNDHACDATRYLVAERDRKPSSGAPTTLDSRPEFDGLARRQFAV